MSDAPPSAALTLSALQQEIAARYLAADAARGTPGTFMWFIEEVGELATALQKAAGQGGQTSGGDNLAEEFADVLAWLCTLANINGIDLTAAVRAKYYQGGGPAGHK
jgi:NTP pyrophosphatase (non-canonical NTP hydrolase)